MTSTTRKESVSTFYRPIQGVTVTHIKQMYDLYASFYENTSLDYESVLRSCIDMPLKWVRKHLLKTHRPAGLDLTPTQRTGASPWPDTDVMHDTLDRQRAS